MARPLRILGSGGHAKVAVAAARSAGFTIHSVLDDDEQRWGTSILGAEIAGPIAGADDEPDIPTVCAIGTNEARKAIVERLRCAWGTIIHPSAIVHDSATIGHGTVVYAGAIIQPDVVIGAHSIVNTAATIDHDCRIGDYGQIGPGANLSGGVELGEGVFLGTGSATRQYVRVGAWTTVGVGGVVVTDLPAGVVAVGVPARPRG